MKLISSNIRFANLNDGCHDWPHRRALLTKLLLNYEADLIGTQEGFPPQLHDLENKLTGFKLIDSHRTYLDDRMYPCIFINPDKIQIQSSGDIWLSKTPYIAGSFSFESAYPRLATWIKAKNINEGYEFIFIVTHLDHVLSSTREEQIKVLITELKKINAENLPLILAGDFNESPKENVRKIITEEIPELIDPWFFLKKEEEASHHHFHLPIVNASRIDWFLVDKKFRAQEIFLDKTHENNIFPSDHYLLKLNILK